MNSTFCKPSCPKFRRRVKYSIARLFGLCLLFSGLEASAEWSATDRLYLENIQTLTSAISSDLVSLNQSISSTTDPLAVRNLLYSIQNNTYGLSQVDSRLAAILAAIQSITNSSPSVFVTNNVSLRADDVLAANPWWATNSAFVLVNNNYSQAYPDDGRNLSGVLSFPQFMSKWSAKLSAPSGSGSLTPSSAMALWGLNSWRDWGAQNQQGYTWFDWITDAFRSNWVSSASYNRDLILALQGMTNSLSFNPVITNSIDFSAFVTNQIALYNWLTNVITPSALTAVVPWWYTNSSFATDWSMYPYVNPTDDRYFMRSFPQEFSGLMSALVRQRITSGDGVGDWDSWGLYKENYRHGDGNTWFDWISEALVSNVVLSTSPSYASLTNDLAEREYYVDDDVLTNTPLPDYSLPSSESIPEAENVLAQGESIAETFVEVLPKPGTSGNPEIVVIPEFTVGGIHVREYRASLATSIVPVCHAVCSFLYAVALACYVFNLARSDYQHFASVGRYWGAY